MSKLGQMKNPSLILSQLFLKKKMVILHRFGFYFVFYDFVVLSQRLVLCHLITTFYFSSSYYDVLFVCGQFKWVKHI